MPTDSNSHLPSDMDASQAEMLQFLRSSVNPGVFDSPPRPASHEGSTVWLAGVDMPFMAILSLVFKVIVAMNIVSIPFVLVWWLLIVFLARH